MYSETCVRKPPLSLALMVDVERWLSYKGTCHVILLAKVHDIYLYVTGEKMEITFFPQPGIEPGPLDLKSYTLPRRYKSRLVPQGNTSVLYTYTQ